MRKPLTKRLARILIGLLLVWVMLMTLAWLAQDRLIFPRWIANPRAMKMLPPGIEVWTRTVDDDIQIEAWFFPAVTHTNHAPAIILTHGNAELIDDHFSTANAYSRSGYHVLIPEYRVYGRSGGVPGQNDIVEDVCHFVERLQSRPDVDRIAMMGRSIGCGVACQVALRHPPDAMVLMVPPARLDTMAWSYGIPGFLVRHPFRSDLALPEIDAPTLIIQRERDEVIPSHHAGILHAAAPNSRLLQVKGSHNIPATPEVEQEAIAAFLSQHVPIMDGPHPAPPTEHDASEN